MQWHRIDFSRSFQIHFKRTLFRQSLRNDVVWSRSAFILLYRSRRSFSNCVVSSRRLCCVLFLVVVNNEFELNCWIELFYWTRTTLMINKAFSIFIWSRRVASRSSFNNCKLKIENWKKIKKWMKRWKFCKQKKFDEANERCEKFYKINSRSRHDNWEYNCIIDSRRFFWLLRSNNNNRFDIVILRMSFVVIELWKSWNLMQVKFFDFSLMSRIHLEICLEVSTDLSDSLARDLDNSTWLLSIHTFICIVIILVNHNTTMLSHLVLDIIITIQLIDELY